MYHLILCTVSLAVGALVSSLVSSIRYNNKHKYLGKLVLTEDTDTGGTYIFAKVKSQEDIDNLKDGEEILFEVEHSTQK